MGVLSAVELSYLKENDKRQEQSQLAKCLQLNQFKVDTKKAALLRSYSAKGKLDEHNIFLILNNDIGKAPPKKRNPVVKIQREQYNRFFTPNQSATEIEQYTVNALEFYTDYLNRSNKQENFQADIADTGDIAPNEELDERAV